MDDDKFLIHIEIAEKSYGIWIKREEEQVVREAAKVIRNKMIQYRQRYAKSDVDVKDLLAMVALQLSINNLQLEDKNDTLPFSEKIQVLTQKLELYLKEN
ncbi:MAG: cell division protein ZapA [Massilibacteroides sp.]|nr:cell division protein ZapA [Massilibacteroides sp.]MDD3063885.1 cell division protein ZapA [Massilibacteroides sp.]MDD4115699.1 cell division protein ZapA [Massilibacteroides sp.]MDD4661364.1 cell division protein ZapA [Massilibacteroides sp.]